MKLLCFFTMVSVFLVSTSVGAQEDGIVRPYIKQIYSAGKTQRQISEELNVSPSLVSKYLSDGVSRSPKIVASFKRNFTEQFFNLYVQKKLREERESLPSILIIKPSFIKQQDSPEVPVLPFPTAIAHRIEGAGKAAFYDHQMIRCATDMMTVSVMGAHHNAAHLEEYRRGLSVYMHLSQEGSLPNALSAIQPTDQALMRALPNTGLLVIGGRASKYEAHEAQNQFEQELIRQAMVRGQPILAICAGCWPLWQYVPKEYEGKRETPGRVKKVHGHAYSKMIYMSEKHGRAVDNTQIHGVGVVKDSLLATILNKYTKVGGNGVNNWAVLKQDPTTEYATNLRVNSVHSWAPDGAFVPDFFQESGLSICDEGLAPANRGGPMDVQEKTIEAFETKHGAPTMGIQWHPEAYNKNKNTKGVLDADKHRAIIQYMAKAGVAYGHRRTMLAELESIFSKL